MMMLKGREPCTALEGKVHEVTTEHAIDRGTCVPCDQMEGPQCPIYPAQSYGTSPLHFSFAEPEQPLRQYPVISTRA